MVLELLFEYGEHESSSVAQILNVVPKVLVEVAKKEKHYPSGTTDTAKVFTRLPEWGSFWGGRNVGEGK